MKVREAFDMIMKFSILRDNSLNHFDYGANDPRLDEPLAPLILKYVTDCKYSLTTTRHPDEELFCVVKKEYFTHADEIILGSLVGAINRTIGALSADELRMVLKNVQLDAILKTICKKEDDNYAPVLGEKTREILIRHIGVLEEWSSQTYEHSQICFGLGLDLETGESSPINIRDLYHDAMLKVLSSGRDTLIVCNKNGDILSYEKLGAARRGICPLSYTNVAAWSANRLAVILTGLGEILIFYDRRFMYTMRASRWYASQPSPLFYKMQEARGYSRRMKEAVIDTCIDASFKRCGACIGVVGGECPIIYDIDCYRTATSPRASFFRQILKGRKFQEIDREIRLELVGIDGATVIDKYGNILAIGAILKLAAKQLQRRTTGGRSVAAQQLAEYGIGIKVSEDGSIEAWRKNAAGDVEKFIELL